MTEQNEKAKPRKKRVDKPDRWHWQLMAQLVKSIEIAMEKRGIKSQADLARTIGMEPSQLSEILSMKHSPTLGTVARIMFGLGERNMIDFPLLQSSNERSDLARQRSIVIFTESLHHLHSVELEADFLVKRIEAHFDECVTHEPMNAGFWKSKSEQLVPLTSSMLEKTGAKTKS